MAPSLEAMGIDRLSVRERLDLIERVWDSLPEQVAADDLPEWHVAELERRRAAAAERPGEGKLWRDVVLPLEGGV